MTGREDGRWGDGDLDAIAADEAILAAVSGGVAIDDDLAGGFLAELRGTLDAEYVGHEERVGAADRVVPEAAAVAEQLTSGERAAPPVVPLSERRGRRYRVTRRAAAIGATAVLALSAGGVAAAYEASPGSPLWPLHRALPGADDSGHHAGAAALGKARALVAAAASAVAGAERDGSISAGHRASVTAKIDRAAAAVTALGDRSSAAPLAAKVADLRRRLAVVPLHAGEREPGESGDRHGGGSGGSGGGDGSSGRSGRQSGRHGGDDGSTSGSGKGGDGSSSGSSGSSGSGSGSGSGKGGGGGGDDGTTSGSHGGSSGGGSSDTSGGGTSGGGTSGGSGSDDSSGGGSSGGHGGDG